MQAPSIVKVHMELEVEVLVKNFARLIILHKINDIHSTNYLIQ